MINRPWAGGRGPGAASGGIVTLYDFVVFNNLYYFVLFLFICSVLFWNCNIISLGSPRDL